VISRMLANRNIVGGEKGGRTLLNSPQEKESGATRRRSFSEIRVTTWKGGEVSRAGRLKEEERGGKSEKGLYRKKQF